MYRNGRGDCRNLIVIVSPSDTGYQGRCSQPFENTGCLITPEEKKKCDDGFFCCYFSELFSEFQYFCHRDVWNRCVPTLADSFNYLLFCYLSPQKELVATGFFGGLTIGKAHRDISAGSFTKNKEGEYVYIDGDKSLSVKFPYDIVLPKLNSMSQAGFIRSVSCSEMQKVMEKAIFVTNGIGSEDAAVMDKINVAIKTLTDASAGDDDELYSKASIVSIAPWLEEALNEVELPQSEDLKKTVRELQDKAAREENPTYLLQAARLQLEQNDYKYVLSLANYCYYFAHQKRKEREYEAATSAYLEAVKLYRHDPVHKRWKEEYVNRCISEYLRIVTYQIFGEMGDEYEFDRYFPTAWEAAQAIAPFISSDVLGRRIESTYFNYRLERIWDNKTDKSYIDYFSENVINRPILSELRPNLVARYYQLMAKLLEQDYTAKQFLSAATYREKAAEVQQGDYRKSSRVSADEDMVECHKDRALAAYLNEDIPGFVTDIDRAIKRARIVNETEPNRRRQENIYFLEGLKYNNLARAPRHDAVREAAIYEPDGSDIQNTEGSNPERLQIDRGIWQINNVIAERPDLGGFERARDIFSTLIEDNLSDNPGMNASEDAKRIYSVLNKSLKYCVTDVVATDDLWDFVYDVATLKKRLNGDGSLLKLAEMTIAWHLSAHFRAGPDGDNLPLLENVHKLVKENPIKPVIFYI